ncbi:MAG: glycosyltransferase [Rhodocyclaceae bacterium]|nr:glycosyltransferase [Rhodocyclaceae bacterium]
MIAYHFPPLAGSSGIQRTLRFVQHLPSFGWEPLVLTVMPQAYERTSADLMGDVPAGTIVERAFALDTARHLAVNGRYAGWMARPDRWRSWQFAGVWQGMRMIERYRPDAIWSTYPIPTAHVISSALHRRSRLPWIADFRDPMAQAGYPADPLTWKSFKAIEMNAVSNASFSTFTTPSAAEDYRKRYPEARERIVVLENGYDEESFAAVSPAPTLALNPGAITLLHSGIVYPEERDPTQLFAALQRLVKSGQLRAGELKIRFRAPVHDNLLQTLAQQFGVAEFIEILPPLPYREALLEMLRADALLVMQAANCNAQIPAKIYEYLRAGRPIIGLTDPAGDTAGVLRDAGIDALAQIDSADEIAALLPGFIRAVKEGRALLADRNFVAKASRSGRTAALARLLSKSIEGAI